MTILNKQFTDKVQITLLNNAIANITTDPFPIPVGDKTLEAFIVGTGLVSCTINVYGCNTKRNTNGIPLATISLSNTSSDQAGSVITSNWGYMYVILSDISGTNAAVTVTLGV